MIKWKISKLLSLVKNSFVAVLKGDFLLRINLGQYLMHIVYTFFILSAIIWASIVIEETMAKVETNKRNIKDLEIELWQKTYQQAHQTKRSEVAKRLKEMGSPLQEANKPATVISK